MSVWDLYYKGTSIIDLYLTFITDLYGTLINADLLLPHCLRERLNICRQLFVRCATVLAWRRYMHKIH